MVLITSGVFFHRFSTAPTPPAPIPFDVFAQELFATSSNGLCVEMKEISQNTIASATEFERFQSGIKPTLFLVQQAVKEDDGRFHFIG